MPTILPSLRFAGAARLPKDTVEAPPPTPLIVSTLPGKHRIVDDQLPSGKATNSEAPAALNAWIHVHRVPPPACIFQISVQLAAPAFVVAMSVRLAEISVHPGPVSPVQAT